MPEEPSKRQQAAISQPPSDTARASLMAGMCTVMTSMFDLDSLCEALAQIVSETIPSEHIFIHLHNAGSGELELIESTGRHSTETAQQLAGSIAARAMNRPDDLCIENSATGSGSFPAPDSGNIGPLIACPIRDPQGEIGVITVITRAREIPGDTNPRALPPVAEFAAAAIRHTRRCAATRTHQADLEESVRLRTNEAREARAALVRQERIAAMGKLAASIAHEVNNPMSFMLSNLHQAAKGTRHLKEVLPDLLALAEHAARLAKSDDEEIDRLRRMGDRSTGGQTSDSILADVRDLEEQIADSMEGAERIRRVSDDMRRFAHGLPGLMDWASVNLIVETALHVVNAESREGIQFVRRLETLPDIRCQRHQIAQVLLNLFQNAIEAVAEAGTIEVRTRSADSWIEIEVADDGPGLAAHRRERIFESFYTTKDEGTGLGLAISREIVQAHRGTLEAIDTPTGACFLLRLPVEAR